MGDDYLDDLFNQTMAPDLSSGAQPSQSDYASANPPQPQAQSPDMVDDTPIDVAASPSHQPPGPDPALSLGGYPKTAADVPVDTQRTPGDDQAPQATPEQIASVKSLQGLPDHKGAFGIHGTLRDILGTLGDAFLVQGGAKAAYAPQRQLERESDAMVGLAQDPAAVVGRLAGAGDPAGALTLRNQLVNQQLSGSRIQQGAQKAGAAQIVAQQRLAIPQIGQIARAISQLPPGDPRAVVLANQAKALAGRASLPDSFLPPDDPQALSQWAVSQAQAGTPQVAQADQRIAETASNHDAMEATAALNAKAHMISATRPSSAHPADPDIQTRAGLVNKIGKVGFAGLTPQEKDQAQALKLTPAPKSGAVGDIIKSLQGGNAPGQSTTPPPHAAFQRRAKDGTMHFFDANRKLIQ